MHGRLFVFLLVFVGVCVCLCVRVRVRLCVCVRIGHAPSRAFGWAQKAIYADSSIVISLDAGYRGDAEDFQLERQLVRKLLYSPTGLSTFFLGVVHNWLAF